MSRQCHQRPLTASSSAAQHIYIVHEVALRLRPLQRVVSPLETTRMAGSLISKPPKHSLKKTQKPEDYCAGADHICATARALRK